MARHPVCISTCKWKGKGRLPFLLSYPQHSVHRRKCLAMRKRALPDEDADVPMRKFKRPHSTTVSSLCTGSSKFHLNVLVCMPQFGKHHHWAVQFHNLATDDGTIFEVQGAHSSYEFSTYQCRPKYYVLRVLQSIRVGQFTLSTSALESIAHAIEHQVQVRNDTVEWNCQDYVIEILDMLEEEWWLDVDDKEYMDAKRQLKRMYGPIELVQKAVLTYPKTTTSDEESDGGCEQEANVEPKKVRSVQFVEDSSGE